MQEESVYLNRSLKMGWFSRTFSNSAEAVLRRATMFFNSQRFNDVRLELRGVDGPEATELKRQCAH